MSRIGETYRAYSRLTQHLDEEIRQRSGSARELERFRETLDVAFYLLGWSQFEYLVRRETENLIDEKATSQTVDQYAWKELRQNVKGLKVRRRLDLIFHANPSVRKDLESDYELRNDIAHDYKKLPREARDVSTWLQRLEALVDKF